MTSGKLVAHSKRATV